MRGVLIRGVIGLVVLGLALLALRPGGGPAPYELTLVLDNAGGLRSGSPVVVGGVNVGEVELSVDEETRKVRADIAIKPEDGPMGKDVTGTIVAQNLLGQKQLELDPGNQDDPAPSGMEIESAKVTTAADLDQLLGVLDDDTRTRLAIFINEAGAAFTGRRADFNQLLEDLQPALGGATDLLDELGRDNLALRNLLATSDRYVAEVTRERRGLTELVDKVGGTAATVSIKRAELRETLADAPAALTTLRGFLGELEETTVPLAPAARQLSASAQPLRAALDQLEPFTDAAEPALTVATDVAPPLTQLAERVTPVLQRAQPALSALRYTTTQRLPGVSSTLDGSIDNIVSVLENWSRAIQYRDGLSHIFRGEGSFAPDAAFSAISRLLPDSPVKRKRRGDPPAASTPATAPAPAPTFAPASPPAEAPAITPLDDALEDLVPPLPKTPKVPGVPQPADPTEDLLDFLLGG